MFEATTYFIKKLKNGNFLVTAIIPEPPGRELGILATRPHV